MDSAPTAGDAVHSLPREGGGIKIIKQRKEYMLNRNASSSSSYHLKLKFASDVVYV